jgi:hypothetical protein
MRRNPLHEPCRNTNYTTGNRQPVLQVNSPNHNHYEMKVISPMDMLFRFVGTFQSSPTEPNLKGFSDSVFNNGSRAELGRRSRKGCVLAITLVSINLNTRAREREKEEGT